ncbi:uncharacterized protein LOC109602362 [Aethina tumida]|uniref:uncharacterized protein LOC109602362 n=1 Tax=Aethina tumida TaxID=116153 RepID=UPI0021499224|nr:uncharacterized protein LOC109602362 [Aethina tumida]
MFAAVSICLAVWFTLGAGEEQAVSVNRAVGGGDDKWMRFSTDYVRCYCNLPACVSTGYMCKSRGGGCFSDLLDHSASSSSSSGRSTVYRGRHGCVELLPEIDQKARCDNHYENSKPYKFKHPKSLFVCCRHDMCNHVENPQTKNILNSTLFGHILEDSSNDPRQVTGHQETLLYSNSEVWFRAATIAVPICGAVILFVLIALAVKILKSENENSPSHKLGPALYIHHLPSQSKNSCEKYPECYDRTYDNLLAKPHPTDHHHNLLFLHQNEEPHRQIHAPLLLQNEVYGDKNETNAKLNLIQNENVCDYLEKNTDHFPEVNIAKKMNGDKFAKL